MHFDFNLTIVVLNDNGFSVFSFQYSDNFQYLDISVFSFQYPDNFQYLNISVFSFQYSNISIFNIQTFLSSKFQILSKHFTKIFQILVFTFQIPNTSHRDFKFQISVFKYSHIPMQTFQFSKLQIPNMSHTNFNFQLSVFTHQNSNISIFKKFRFHTFHIL